MGYLNRLAQRPLEAQQAVVLQVLALDHTCHS